MKTPEKPKRLCASCDHYEVCQFHSHAGVLHELNANRCGLYSDRTHDRKRIAVLEQVVEEGNMQIQRLEAVNAELLTKVEQLESKCRQPERDRDAVDAMPRWISVEERLPEEKKEVLCFYIGEDGTKWRTVGAVVSFLDGGWRLDIYYDDYDCDYVVTHWMPLPEPPKEADHADAT